jgi:hypothetical protein
MIDNPTFAIVCIEQKADKQADAIYALNRTAFCLPFKRCSKILISPFSLGSFEDIKHINQRQLGPMTTEVGFVLNRFILRDLPSLLSGVDFFIMVQSDGYAVNQHAWCNDFLDYDYIGAPLPLWQVMCISPLHPSRRVGSGGFSLRSRKWYELGLTAPVFTGGCEDIFCSITHLRHWTDAGCKVAPVRLALRWCMEHQLEDYPGHSPSNSFGFHGLYRGRPVNTLSVHEAFTVMCGRWWKLYTRHWRKGNRCV